MSWTDGVNHLINKLLNWYFFYFGQSSLYALNTLGEDIFIYSKLRL